MTQQEYLDLSALAKVRSAEAVLNGVCVTGEKAEVILRKAVSALVDLDELLAKRVKTE